MKKIKTGSIVMGVLFILAAAALIISNLFPEMQILGGITFWQIAAAVLFGALLVNGFVRGSALKIFFSIAFIYSVFIPQISSLVGRDVPNAWIALLTALLLCIGVKLITGSFHFGRNDKAFIKINGTDTPVDHLGNYCRYIDCADFENVSFGDILGRIQVYFENTELYKDGSTLRFGDILGQIEVYVPKSWRVNLVQEDVLGVVNVAPSEGPIDKTININIGDILGKVDILRI